MPAVDATFLDELHSAGYAKSGGHHLDAAQLRKVLNTDFNERIGVKRRQGSDPSWATQQQRYYSKLARQLGVMETTADMEKYVTDVMALESEAGGVRGENHADSAPRDSLRGEDTRCVPVVILHAVMGGSRVHVFPQDGRGEQTVELQEGDVLFMRGDLGHAGAGYDADNVRVHAYIECEPRTRRKKRARSETQQVRQTYAF